MRVLVACEFSGIVRDAFLAEGHDAYSCDLLETESRATEEHIARHFVGDVFDIIPLASWDLMIAHPPCTYLTNAGVRHLNGNITSRNGKRAEVSGVERFHAMWEAAKFFNALKESGIPRIAIENPVPHKYAVERIGKYDQIIQPWQFGHDERKAICLWLKNLPPLIPTRLMPGRAARANNESPGPNRAKERSRFFVGVALAMAAQWGNL